MESSEAICTVLIQGSTSLGVSFKNSDVDAVLVTPNFVYREDFFNSFAALLQKHPKIKDLLTIPETFVPLIKMRIEGTSVSQFKKITLEHKPIYFTKIMQAI